MSNAIIVHPHNWYDKRTRIVNGVSRVDANTSGVRKFLSSSKVGSKNLAWKSDISAGKDATTNYSRSFITGIHETPCISSVFGAPNVYSYGNQKGIFQLNMLAVPDDPALRDHALSRIKSRLSSANGNKNLLLPIAELKDMRGLITSAGKIAFRSATSLTNIITDASKQKMTAEKAANLASEAWLTYSFAINPMVNDINEINAAISQKLDSKIERFSGSASKTWTDSTTILDNATGPFGSILSSVDTRVHVLKYRYIAGVMLRFSSGNDYGRIDHLGLNVSSLPSTLYNLLPYSWMLDYFSTVGDYLEDVFEAPQTNTLYCMMNKKYTVRRSIRSTVRASVYTVTSMSPGICSLTQGYFSRSKLSSIPRRSLRIKSADEIAIGGLNKVTNLLSVLVSRNTRRHIF